MTGQKAEVDERPLLADKRLWQLKARPHLA